MTVYDLELLNEIFGFIQRRHFKMSQVLCDTINQQFHIAREKFSLLNFYFKLLFVAFLSQGSTLIVIKSKLCVYK